MAGRYKSLRLEGCEYGVNYESIVLEGPSGQRISGTIKISDFVQGNTKRGKVPTLMRDGSVSGLNGVHRWWALVTRQRSGDDDGRRKIHPGKVSGVYKRLVRIEDRLQKRLLRNYEMCHPVLEACFEAEMSISLGMEVLNVSKDGGRLSYTVSGGTSPETKFWATELRGVKLSASTQFRDDNKRVGTLQKRRARVESELREVATQFASTAAPAPEGYNSLLLLTTSCTSTATAFAPDTQYAYSGKASWSRYAGASGGSGAQYVRVQTVCDPQCALEWFVCHLPYGYKEP